MATPLLSFLRVARADVARRRRPPAAVLDHLAAAEQWLCRAHDAGEGGGVSYGYSLKGGWRAPYPETSGYIAATFFRLARWRDAAFLERGRRIARWLVSIQNDDGSFANPRYGPQGIVFDTGQVLFGLVAAHEATGDPACLEAARRAAAWLVGVADAEGRWTRREHLDTPHVYNTRTAWALLCLDAVEHDPARVRVARANLDWALAEQNAQGWFAHCGFAAGAVPFTHTIAYAAQGLLEAGALLGEPRYLDAARRCAEATLALLDDDGGLPARIDLDGRATGGGCCLTGNCQFAIVWSRLAALLERPDFARAAERSLERVMRTQDLSTRDDGVRGAIKGSDPIWGPYAPWTFPNWASKFFVDAIALRLGAS